MKDAEDKEIQLNDIVSYAYISGQSAMIGAGKVVGFTPTQVKVEDFKPNWRGELSVHRHKANKCIVMQLTWFDPISLVRWKNQDKT
jgi:hypothetical protein